MEAPNGFPQSKTNEKQAVDLLTPPVSPINGSLASNPRSVKITAGQTGLPWLAKDAEGGGPQESTESPPPKFEAKPRIGSLVRFPTRKRTNQKYVYRMKDGISPVKILCKRLKSWQLSVKYLMSLFKRIKKVEIKNGKSYRKIDTNFAIPSKIQDQFKSSNGVQDAWAAFRQFTRENSLIHQDFVEFIENEIIPTLNIMLTDIHHFMHSLTNNKNLHTGSLFDHRKKADAIMTKLNKEIYQAANDYEDSLKNGKGPYFIPKRDPLLTKYEVINTIKDLHKHENRLHKDFLAAQDEYRKFEQEKVIDVYTALFQTFEKYRTEHGLERSEGVSKIVSIFSAIETDSEWQEFLHHHQSELVKSTAAFKDEHALDFPNASHPLLQPLVIGDMKRKTGSKWHSEYYVLSAVGMFYCFKSEKDFYHRPHHPNFSTFVPACSAQANPTNQSLELTGKALGFLGRKKHLEFTTTQPQELERWTHVMNSIASNQQTAPPATASTHRSDNGPNTIQATSSADTQSQETSHRSASQDENAHPPELAPTHEQSKDEELVRAKGKKPVREPIQNDPPEAKRQESDVFYDTVS